MKTENFSDYKHSIYVSAAMNLSSPDVVAASFDSIATEELTNCLGSAGTLGCLGSACGCAGSFGTLGSYGCY